jgi:type I restriction enzyme S subunit
MKTGISESGMNITHEKFSQLVVPVAPRPEQKRIADKLDTVLTRVDAVNTRLARVAPILKRFRQSVLAAATSGRLTEDWRAQSQAPTRSTIALGDMVISIDQGWSPKCEANAAPQEQWAVIKTTAIQALHFYPEENKALPNNLDPRPHLALRDGDVLITRAGPRSRAGVTCIVTGDQPRLMLCDKAYRVRVDRSKIHPQMLNLLLNSPEVLDAIDEMKTGISESGVNLTQAKFRELALSVPHKEEQTEIIRRVETLFAFADRLEARLETAQTAADRLTPSLLAKAFRGELVPQDPNDEPASELLKRLAMNAPLTAKTSRKARESSVNHV